MKNMPEIFQLSYVSSLTLALEDDELLELAEKAQAWNEDHDITSLMLISEYHVIQCLEGPQEKVEALFGKIELDIRHADVICLNEIQKAERDFPEQAFDFQMIASWLVEHKLPDLIDYLEDPLIQEENIEALKQGVDQFIREHQASSIKQYVSNYE